MKVYYGNILIIFQKFRPQFQIVRRWRTLQVTWWVLPLCLMILFVAPLASFLPLLLLLILNTPRVIVLTKLTFQSLAWITNSFSYTFKITISTNAFCNFHCNIHTDRLINNIFEPTIILNWFKYGNMVMVLVLNNK